MNSACLTKLSVRFVPWAALLILATTQAHADPAKGKAIFDGRCIACHGPGGAGIPGLAPTLAGGLPYVDKDAGRQYVAGVLTQGLSGKIVSKGQTFMGAMPSQADLSDEDVASVANHLASLNGATGAPFKAADIAAARTRKADHKSLRDQRATLTQ